MIKKGIPIEKDTDEPIKIALKVKDKEIRNTQTLVKALSNENKEMRKILDKYTDSNTKRELSDKLIDIERENNKLKNEVKTLKLLNKPHETCPREKENLERTLKNLVNELQNCKNRVLEEQLEYKKLEKKYYSNGKDNELILDKNEIKDNPSIQENGFSNNNSIKNINININDNNDNKEKEENEKEQQNNEKNDENKSQNNEKKSNEQDNNEHNNENNSENDNNSKNEK